MNFLTNFIKKYLTLSRGTADISKTREISASSNREVSSRPIVDSFSCPYCGSQNFSRRGFRQKKLEKVQLYICLSCNKTFTPHSTKGKHYPLSVMLDAVSIYNLGYSLEQTCRIVNQRLQKTASFKAANGGLTRFSNDADLRTSSMLDYHKHLVKSQMLGVDLGRVEPPRPEFLGPAPEPSRPTPKSVYQFTIQPSTLSNWLSETANLCRFSRMREFALKKLPNNPKLWLTLGLSYYKLGDKTHALLSARQSVILAPSDMNYYVLDRLTQDKPIEMEGF